MPRQHCIEDDFEFRVNNIFTKLRREYADEETSVPFLKWLEQNHKAVGVAFLDDIDTYMGIPLLEGEERE